MSLAYLKKKRAQEKVDRALQAAENARLEAAARAERSKQEAEARRARDRAEFLAQNLAREATAYERELAAKVKARGGVYCGHGRHFGGHHGTCRHRRREAPAKRRLTPMEAVFLIALS